MKPTKHSARRATVTAAATAAAFTALTVAPSAWPVPAASAWTTTLTCGSVITTSITLDHDLRCPTGVGLYVSGNQPVTINLAGHSIIGRPGTSPTDSSGIFDTSAPYRVENGTIRGFTGCVYSYGTFTLKNMTFRNCSVTDVNAGNPTHPATVSDSSFDHATFFVTQAAAVLDGDRFLHGAGLSAIGFEYTYIRVTGTSIRSYDRGIYAFGEFNRARITGNTIIGGGTGIQLGGVQFGDDIPGVISSNLIADNHGDGISLASSTSLASDNPASLTVSHNLLTHNGGDGLRAVSPDFGTDNLTLGANAALGNGGHGIDVAAPGVVVTDAGGNVAHGNADPQCIGLTCR